MTATPDAPARPLELVYVPPGSLLLDRNVRLHTSADTDLVESIRLHGILQPIVAVWTAHGGHDGDGDLRVKFGHRRTVAALAAEQRLVPVLIAGDEATDDPGQIDRVLTQMAENDARAGLTQLDRVNAVEQLAAFGLTADQIAVRTKRTRAEVEAAQAIAKSTDARGLLMDQPDLDLVQAAWVAEFEGNPDAQEKARAILTGPTYGGSKAHAMQRLRDSAAEIALLAAAGEKATGLGYRVIPKDTPGYRRLDSLSASPETRPNPISPDEHAACPGHAVFISWEYGPVLASTLTPLDADGPVLGWVSVTGTTREVQRCPVCRCTEDSPCMVTVESLADEDQGDEFEEPCDWSDVEDPQNPGETVCTACVDDDDNVIESRRKPVIEDANLPGDESAEEPVRGKWLTVEAVCTDPDGNGHVSMYDYGRGATPKKKMAELPAAEQVKARAERKDVIDSNKAWKPATTVRRRWLKEFLARKTPPKGTGAFLTAVLADHALTDRPMRQGTALAHELLGVKEAKAEYGKPGAISQAAEKASDARAQVIALGFALALCEDQTDTNTWRRKLPYEQTYFRFLAACGYELADVEKRVIDGKKADA